MTTFNSLLVGGADGWHNGGEAITYSFLGATIPSYYERVDTDGDTVPDKIRINPGDPSDDLPLDANASMTVGERILSELAVSAWNEVANINLVPGSIDDGPETGAPVTGDGNLIGGLGGASGFGEIEVPRNDDGSSFYNISSVFAEGLNFFGNTYTDIFVNTNGNISFGSSIGTFTPFQISGGSTPIIAPFWADVDTRQDADDASPDSAPIFVDMDEVNGVLTVTWSGVGYYFQNAETTNSFQLQMFDRGGGDFDIVFRYADLNWTTGDASGGTGGLGGTPARAGYSAGNGGDFFELSQSGDGGAMLGLEGTVGNTGEQGLYVFKVRNGGTVGDITFGAADFTGDPNTFGFVSDFPGELGTRSNHGDVWINRGLGLQNAAQFGNTGWQTYLHELGHALGLTHPDQDPNNTAGDPRNNNQYTVMSYDVHPGQVGVPDESSAWPITPMLFDIQAIQALYGPNLSTRAGDDVYFGTGATAFALADGGLLANGMGAILCAWDAGGTDLFSGANQSGPVTLNLNPGAFSTIGAIPNNIGLAAAVRVGGVIVNLIENALGSVADDRLIGNVGANILDGGVGADRMLGGDGNDTFLVDNSDDTALEDPDEGNDLVISSANFALSDHVERLTLTGAAVSGVGNDIVNVIVGNELANILNGRGGADTMRGGDGDDIFMADSGADRALETATGGVDLVKSSVNYVLGINVENLTLIGTAARGTGNGLVNILIGNARNNMLDGAGGADSMRGGGGNDIYMVNVGADQAIEAAGAGTDIVRSTINFTLGTNVENLTLLGTAEKGTGNNLANTLTGNDQANLLDGAGGADTMRGGDGDDTYLADDSGDAAIEAAAMGTDVVRSSASFILGNNVENLILIGSAARGTGNGLANAITGNDANNILDGAGGADTMRGNDGNDLYMVDNGGDKALEAVGAGIDTVSSSLNFTLGNNLENLVLTGTAARGTGNALANALTGNAVANLLDGAGGADTMRGGGGNDSYTVNAVGDKALEAAGAGNDIVRSSVDFTLGNNVERLTLTGTAAIDGTGNALANMIVGNNGANLLNGAGGADSLSGGLGNDRLFGGTGDDDLRGGGGADRFYFDTALNENNNVDRILDFSAADDTIMLDRTIFDGIAANGTLSVSAFRAGTVAMDADDRILYNRPTGEIFYDADGNGDGDAILIGLLLPAVQLTNADFVAVG